MAQAKLQKIRVTGSKKHYKVLMQELHRQGLLEIIETPEFIQHSTSEADDHFGVFDLAKISFAIDFLTPFSTPGSKIEGMLSGGKVVLSEEAAKDRLTKFGRTYEGIISEAEKLEEVLVRSKNERAKIPSQLQLVKQLGDFEAPLASEFITDKSFTLLGSVDRKVGSKFLETIAGLSHRLDAKILSEDKSQTFFRVTALKGTEEEVQKILETFQFEELDVPEDLQEFFGEKLPVVKTQLDQKNRELGRTIEDAQSRAQALSAHLEDLKIMFDYNSWRKRKNDLQGQIFYSDSVFAFEAWMPKSAYKGLKTWMKNVFVGEVVLERISPEKGETVPVMMDNQYVVRSFEPITEMFGIPQAKEFDPTVLLAPFFVIFFGLCLSDVGYGLILTLVSTWFLVWGKFGAAAKDSLRLILYCGLAAMAGGVLLGGYLGMTAEQLPWLVNEATRTAEGTVKFYGQILTPTEGAGPIQFLALALGLGVIQLFFGMGIDFAQKLRNKQYSEAFFDTATWMFFLASLGLFALTPQLGLNPTVTKYAAILGAILILLTQGRHQKNWLLKPVYGLLGLYNTTNYISDLLSYSRIMALGLATGVVAFAMNLTAGIFGEMMPNPVLGFVVATFVVLLGHSLNFSLSLLGAFIHSGRLQFIEFFGKFYEGGGKKFKPFQREKKYLFFR